MLLNRKCAEYERPFNALMSHAAAVALARGSGCRRCAHRATSRVELLYGDVIKA